MIDNDRLARIAYITWSSMGITFDRQEETTEQLTMWISVPEHSHHTDDDGIEMADMHLAKRFKNALTKMGIKRLKVLAKVRKGENWTKEDADAAVIRARKEVYGSQW